MMFVRTNNDVAQSQPPIGSAQGTRESTAPPRQWFSERERKLLRIASKELTTMGKWNTSAGCVAAKLLTKIPNWPAHLGLRVDICTYYPGAKSWRVVARQDFVDSATDRVHVLLNNSHFRAVTEKTNERTLKDGAVQNVPGDGDCLYHALLTAMSDEQKIALLGTSYDICDVSRNIERIRAMSAEALIQNPDFCLTGILEDAREQAMREFLQIKGLDADKQSPLTDATGDAFVNLTNMIKNGPYADEFETYFDNVYLEGKAGPASIGDVAQEFPAVHHPVLLNFVSEQKIAKDGLSQEALLDYVAKANLALDLRMAIAMKELCDFIGAKIGPLENREYKIEEIVNLITRAGLFDASVREIAGVKELYTRSECRVSGLQVASQPAVPASTLSSSRSQPTQPVTAPQPSSPSNNVSQDAALELHRLNTLREFVAHKNLGPEVNNLHAGYCKKSLEVFIKEKGLGPEFKAYYKSKSEPGVAPVTDQQPTHPVLAQPSDDEKSAGQDETIARTLQEEENEQSARQDETIARTVQEEEDEQSARHDETIARTVQEEGNEQSARQDETIARTLQKEEDEQGARHDETIARTLQEEEDEQSARHDETIARTVQEEKDKKSAGIAQQKDDEVESYSALLRFLHADGTLDSYLSDNGSMDIRVGKWGLDFCHFR